MSDNTGLSDRRSSRRRSGSALGLAAVALVAVGCGSSSSAGSAAPAASPAATNQPNFATNFVDVSGKLVSVAGTNASVQTKTSTSPIAWGTSTRFTTVSSVSLASLATGDCVSVTSANRTAGNNPGSTPTVITATNVSVTSTSGCPKFTFGGTGPRNGTPPSGRVSGAPIPAPTGSSSAGGFGGRGFGGGGGGFGGGFGGAIGTIASISGTSFVVTPRFGSATTTVKTNAATMFSTTSSATSSAMVVGQCVIAIGEKAADGTVDSHTITVSPPHNGTCTTVTTPFPGGPGFGFGGGARGSGSSAPVANA